MNTHAMRRSYLPLALNFGSRQEQKVQCCWALAFCLQIKWDWDAWTVLTCNHAPYSFSSIMVSHIALDVATVATIPIARAVVIGIVTEAVAWQSAQQTRLSIYAAVFVKGIRSPFYDCAQFDKLYTCSNHRTKRTNVVNYKITHTHTHTHVMNPVYLWKRSERHNGPYT